MPDPALSHSLRGVHPGARKALEVVFADRLHLGRVDRMQRNFEPVRKRVEAWQGSELTNSHRQGRDL